MPNHSSLHQCVGALGGDGFRTIHSLLAIVFMRERSDVIACGGGVTMVRQEMVFVERREAIVETQQCSWKQVSCGISMILMTYRATAIAT